MAVVCVVFSSVASAQEGAVARPRTLSPFAASKARALFRGRLPCAGCHMLDGAGGRIGPDLTRVSERRAAAYVRRMIDDPQAVVPGTVMPKVPMPLKMRELVVAYLTRNAAPGLHPDAFDAASASAPDARRAEQPDGRALYARYCTACHGARGHGDGSNAAHLAVPPARHADPGFMSRRSDDRLFDAIYAGGLPLGRSVTMPPYGATLTRRDIWALVRHLRELCGCSGPEWSTDGDARAAVGRPR